MKYLLLVRTAQPSLQPTAAENDAAIRQYGAWARSLSEDRRLVDANELDDHRTVLSAENGEVRVTDGPFAETREVVGGYFIFSADTPEQAIEIAKGCPAMKRGGQIELRAIIEH